MLVFLTPLGIFLPEKFNAGGAWGEWSAGKVQVMTGYLPVGLARLEGLWKAIFPNYAIPGLQKPWQHRIAYMVTGGIGTVVVIGIGFGLGKWLSRGNKTEGKDAP